MVGEFRLVDEKDERRRGTGVGDKNNNDRMWKA